MKNFFKFLGIISLSLIIGFSMASCGGGGGDDDDNKNGNKGGPSFWTAADLTGVYTTEQTIISVASSGTMFIATTDSGSGKLAKSDDGVTWTVLHNGGALPGTGMNANKVAYGNGLFFAMNQNVAYSEDIGATWNMVTGANGFGSSPTNYVNGIFSKTDAAGTTSHFIAVRNGGGPIKHSADGKDWNTPTLDYIDGGVSSGDNVSDGIFAFNIVVLVGKSGLIVRSENPSFAAWSTSGSTVNMTAAKTGPFYAESFANRINVNGVAYSNTKGILVAVGDKGKIAYSSDGSVWMAATSPFGDTIISDVAFGGGKFVAVGYGGKTATSDDTGKTWTLVSNSSTADIYNIAFGSGKFVAVGKGWIGYSE